MQKTHPKFKFYGLVRPVAVGISVAKDDPNSSRKYRRAQFKLQKAGK